MSWTRPKDLKAQLVRLWERGDLLRDAVTGHARFALRLSLKGPASGDVTERFEAVRAWAFELAQTPCVRLQWQQVNHRVQGMQQLPVSAWVDSLDDALRWLGKRSEWSAFSDLLAQTRQQCPALLAWLEKRPLQALDLQPQWPLLLAVVGWMQRHPRPGIYLRQVDLPGVHSKFIEAHRAVLAELLDLALPATSIDSTQTGVTRFAARYGFAEKPLRIRMRVLDPALSPIAGLAGPDLTLDADSFSRLSLGARQVLITENETNFLALPSLGGTIALFGAGYGWEALAPARWLAHCAIHYWGDIDTHGFAILDQLRAHFAHTQSLLMDRATLEVHAAFWGQEDKPHPGELARLTDEEWSLYDDLRHHRIRARLRLEQEHLGFGWVQARLQGLQDARH